MEGRPEWLTARRGEWLDAVRSWVHEHVADMGEELRSMDPVKERPWGAVLRVETSVRTLYAKAVGPQGRHELRLLADLGSMSSGLTPEVLGADHARGWVLMSDHGSNAIDARDPRGELAAVEQLLPAYAEVQRASAPLVPTWIEAGVPDRAPSRLPGLLDQLLGGHGATGPLPLDRTELDDLRLVVADLERAGRSLATSSVPLSIDHGDIHGTNVLVGAGGARLIDWGDACISHPFTSLLVPVEWVAARLPSDEQTEAVRRLREAYLEPWGRDADLEVLGLAVWVAYVARAISNDEQCAGGAPEHVRDGQREIVALLRAWHGKRADLARPERLLTPVLEL